MTDERLIHNIEEHMKNWPKEPKLTIRLIINEIIIYLLTKLK